MRHAWKQHMKELKVQRYIVPLLSVMLIVFQLLFALDLYSNVLSATLISCVACVAIFIRSKIDFVKLYLVSKWSVRIQSVLLGALFLLLLPITNLFTRHTEYMSVARISVYTLFSGGIWIITSAVMLFIFAERNERNSACDLNVPYDGGALDKAWGYRAYFVMIVIFSVLNIISCYPGLPHGDGWTNWKMARGFMPWTDWHPVGWLFFIRVLQYIWYNPFVVVLAQTAIWIYVNYYALKMLDKHKGKSACKLYFVCSLAGIMSYSYLRVIYKDVIFSICLLGFVAALWSYMMGERGKWNCIHVVLFGVLTSGFRHMMVVPVGAALVFVVIDSLRRRVDIGKSILLCIMVPVLYLGSNTALMLGFQVEKNPGYITYTVPIQMMAAYATTGDVDEESLVFMENYAPVEAWASHYVEFFADPVSRPGLGFFNETDLVEMAEHGGEIIGTNLRFFMRKPLVYLQHFLQENNLIWEIAESDRGWVWGANEFEDSSKLIDAEVPAWSASEHYNFATALLKPIEAVANDFGPWRVFAFHAGIWNFLLLACLLKCKRRKDVAGAISMIPLFILDVVLMLSIPVSDARYVMPVIASAGFVISTILGSGDRRE